jgi:hypothetical protein
MSPSTRTRAPHQQLRVTAQEAVTDRAHGRREREALLRHVELSPASGSGGHANRVDEEHVAIEEPEGVVPVAELRTCVPVVSRRDT